MAETLHIGRKIGRIRELRGLKQESLAEALGISQQSVSRIEQNDQIEDATLERVAKALGVTPEAIKNFTEESAIYNIQNNYDSATNNVGQNTHHHCTFNPLDEIKKLNEEKDALYSALLKEKDEKIAMMYKLI